MTAKDKATNKDQSMTIASQSAILLSSTPKGAACQAEPEILSQFTFLALCESYSVFKNLPCNRITP